MQICHVYFYMCISIMLIYNAIAIVIAAITILPWTMTLLNRYRQLCCDATATSIAMLVYLYCDATATTTDSLPPPVLRCCRYYHWFATATCVAMLPVLRCYHKRYWFATANCVAMLPVLHWCSRCHCHCHCHYCKAATASADVANKLMWLLHSVGYVLCDVYLDIVAWLRVCCLRGLLACCLFVVMRSKLARKQGHSVFPTEDERDRKWLSIFIWPR